MKTQQKKIEVLHLFKSISGEYEVRKAKYDKINAGYESNRSQLEAVRTVSLNKQNKCLLN